MAKLDAAARMAGAMEGKKLPAVTFLDQDGNKVKSSELKAPAVLYFYPKDDTPGCTTEACGIRDNWAAFRKAGLTVYGVSKDDAKSHQKFIAKYELPFPLLTADEAALEKLGAWQEKSMYGKTYMGIQRMTYLIGKDGKVLKTYPKVKPEEHAAELLADFKALA
ncbi:MAG: thioredoxin-dependent peroxiredoxin [Thermoplasmata archaeon]|jgi:peroxiredoxin Q/BCP|nr:thioredoxin-dependent peroxiredoxin [Thermoplasmata archaeon]